MKKYFSGDSKDVIYTLICKTCNNLYFAQAEDSKKRIAKNKSGVKNLHYSTCRVCSDIRTATKPSHIFKYFLSSAKQILNYKNIKINDIFSDGILH